MNENVKIFALGGMDENGKSLYVVDYNYQLYIFLYFVFPLFR